MAGSGHVSIRCLPASSRRERAQMERPAVFADRDGVLNVLVCSNDGNPRAPRTFAELELMPGVVDGVTALRDAGFLVIAGTNQPDVARRDVSIEVVEEMNDVVRRQARLDA